MVPEPDYNSSDEESEENSKRREHALNHLNAAGRGVMCDERVVGDGGGLIQPKKLYNPVQLSAERQDLHKELLFNQKIGRSVLHKKDELQKEFERRQEKQRVKELDVQRRAAQSALEKRLHEQAEKLRIAEEIETQSRSPMISERKGDEPEFFRVHAQLTSKQRIPCDT